MVDPKPRRSLSHWSLLIPLLALGGWIVGFAAESLSQRAESELTVTPPPESQLQPITLPPRARFLAGAVRGPHDEPIVEALVALIASDEPHWTYTDAHGAFRLDGMARGPWSVRVVAVKHAPIALTLADDGTPAVIRLPDEALTAPTMPALARAPFAARVSGAEGVTLEGLELVLTPTASPTSFDAPLPRRATFNARGECALDDLIVGEYSVIVLPEWARGGSWPDLARALGGQPRRIVHPDSSAPRLEIELESGTVTGRVASPDGNPLEGALVLVSPENRPDRVWLPIAADARGEFTVGTLPAGRYLVTVQAGGALVRQPADVPARGTIVLPLPPFGASSASKDHE